MFRRKDFIPHACSFANQKIMFQNSFITVSIMYRSPNHLQKN